MRHGRADLLHIHTAVVVAASRPYGLAPAPWRPHVRIRLQRQDLPNLRERTLRCEDTSLVKSQIENRPDGAFSSEAAGSSALTRVHVFTPLKTYVSLAGRFCTRLYTVVGRFAGAISRR